MSHILAHRPFVIAAAFAFAASLLFATGVSAQSTNVQPIPSAGTASGSSLGGRTNFVPPSGGFGLRNPLGSTSVPVIIGRVVSWMGGFAGSLFFLYLLWGGFDWMTAGGDGKRVEQGKKKMVAAASGIAVILLAYMAVAAIIGAVPR